MLMEAGHGQVLARIVILMDASFRSVLGVGRPGRRCLAEACTHEDLFVQQFRIGGESARDFAATTS